MTAEEIIQEAIRAAQAAEQQTPAEGNAAADDKLAAAFIKATPLLKGLEVLKDKSPRTGLFMRHKFNFKAEKRGDHVRISTNVQFFKSDKSTLSVNVYNDGAMTVLFNDPGTHKSGAVNGTADALAIVGKGAAKTGLIS